MEKQILEEYLDLLYEAPKRTTRTTVKKQTKIKRSTSQMSTAMARKKNDSQYKMMKKYCELCKQYRERIHKKYASKNRSRARK